MRPTLILAVLALACGPTVTGAGRDMTGAPPVTHCTADQSMCDGNVPKFCSRDGRAWVASPACPFGCVVDQDGARCNAAPVEGVVTGSTP